MLDPSLRRHDLVWVDPAAWTALLEGRPGRRAEPLVVDWARRGWPLIVRRPCCDDAEGVAPLGLPLPPQAGKRRLAFAIHPRAITRRAPPPLLADVAASAPTTWRASIAGLLHLDGGVRVYGGLAWQHLTGLAYLSASSDLDLLWRRRDAVTAKALLAGLCAISSRSPMRIDGELVDADGTAVNWRELTSGAAEVLGKRLDAVIAVNPDIFLAGQAHA
jgi:phosphoribosyl-dephospho-CoA transferase